MSLGESHPLPSQMASLLADLQGQDYGEALAWRVKRKEAAKNAIIKINPILFQHFLKMKINAKKQDNEHASVDLYGQMNH